MLAHDLKEVFQGVVEGRLERTAWQTAVLGQNTRPKLEQLQLVSKVRKIPVAVMLDLPVILLKLALVQPNSINETMDGLAAAWQSKWQLPLPELPGCQHEVPAKIWELLWEHVEAPEATSLFELAAIYPGLLDAYQRDQYARFMLGKTQIYRETILEHLKRPAYTLDSLAHHPEGTLGYGFYHLLVDNNLSLDGLDSAKYVWVDPRVAFVGQRYLQTHDIWHTVLDYSTKPYAEVALQVINLAQIGNAFSAYLPAMLANRFLFSNPSQLTFLFDLIFQSWLHGRQIPPLMPIKWEEMWHLPLAEIRQRYGINPQPIANQYLFR